MRGMPRSLWKHGEHTGSPSLVRCEVLASAAVFMADTWHAEMVSKLAGFWTFIGLNIGLSLIMTWVYLSTNRSILAGMLLHFTSNFTSQLFAPTSDRVEITHVVLMLVIGLATCILLDRRSRVQERRLTEAVRSA